MCITWNHFRNITWAIRTTTDFHVHPEGAGYSWVSASCLSTHSLGIWLAVFLHDAHSTQCCICIILMSEMINNKTSRAQLSPQVQQDVCSDCRLKNKHESRRKRWDVCWAEPNHHHFTVFLGTGLMGIICTINKDVQNYSLHSVKCFSHHFPCNDFKRYKSVESISTDVSDCSLNASRQKVSLDSSVGH